MNRPICLLLAALCCLTGSLAAKSPRILAEGVAPPDPRLEPLKDLNGYFPFRVPDSLEAWEKRADDLQQRVLVANGLWPLWERTPLNPVIYGKIERPGFTVEKVYFESLPGFYVTGLLFRPEGEAKENGPLCCALTATADACRITAPKESSKQIAMGAEKFEESGRTPKVARAAGLARLGCVTFLYDMIGYADSRQLSRQLVHGFKTQRPEMEGKNSWGFFSTQAELRLQSVFGLQAWNSIRGLDFLESLPDVDPKRIGVTGGSGGGTQTIILGAIDPRPVVAFPNGMVSTSMQGGCTCENTVLLRIGTGNVELAGLFAPKPQGMTAANDWTKEMMTKGFPQLQRLYELHGKKDFVSCQEQTHFPHNYNSVTRGEMYKLNHHLGLGHEDPIVEEDFKILTAEEHAIWDADHPEPEAGDAFERKLTRYLADESDKQIGALKPGSEDFRKVVGGAWKTMIGYDDAAATLEVPLLISLDLLAKHGPETVIWIDGAGKDALFDENEKPIAGVNRILESGKNFVTADLFMQGEYLPDGKPISETRKVANPREFAGYTFGYNHPLFAHRVHDILNLIAVEKLLGTKKIHLIGTNGAGPWVAAAAAVADDFEGKIFVDDNGFRFANLKSYRDPQFLPGAVKYGDLPGLLALFENSNTDVKTSANAGITKEAIEWLLK